MPWDDVTLEGEPILIIGLRDKRGWLDGFRINVDRNVHSSLMSVAESALEYVKGLTAVPYTPYVGHEDGEYLSLDVNALSSPPQEDTEDRTEKEETARLVAIIRESDAAREMGAGELVDRLDDEFYLQAICFEHNGARLGFVTKAKPMQVIKRSMIPLGKDDSSDKLKKISRPELVLESNVHAIVGPSEIAILNRTQFQFMVSDSKLISQHVPAQVRRIKDAFSAKGIGLSSSTVAALTTKAESSTRIAKRLDAFAERVSEIDISKLQSGAGFTDQDLVPDDFVNSDGELQCETERVQELLDALEGRFFSDAFSPEKRRADYFRARR